MIELIKVIIAIAVVVLINYKELNNSKPKGRIMGIYFFVMGISLILGILISLDKAPDSPNMMIMNVVKYLGLEVK